MKTRAVALYRQMVDSWNRRDAESFAALFTRDGNTVGFDGSPLDGRQMIASSLGSIFSNHPTSAYVSKVREVRELGPGVVLLRAAVGMVPPGKSELSPAVNCMQSVVMVEQDGKLQISLLQNTPAAFHGRPQLADAHTRELTEVLQSGQTVHATEVG